MDDKEDQLSDEEIFNGKLSLKEIKHMLVINHSQRQTITASEISKVDNHNNSLLLISTQSEPDINKGYKYKSPETKTKALSNVTLSPNEPDMFSAWDVTSEDSFLKVEKMIEASESLCESSSKEGLDNTLEAIEKILKHAPERSPYKCEMVVPIKGNGLKLTPHKDSFADAYSKESCLKSVSSPMFTPVKHERNDKEIFATPSSVLITKSSIKKTPANPPLYKNTPTSSVKKTPNKSNAFKHIASPVAYYIKNSPQIPLIQNVNSRKPLTGISSIPKLVKSTIVKPSNKENVNLPAVAYKSAKKTTVIDVSNGPKLPQSQWAKKLTKSLPKPVVMKHTHRVKDFVNNSLGMKQEESFGDLSLQQADVSVYTKKNCFPVMKKHD